MREYKTNYSPCIVVQSTTLGTVPSPLNGERVRVRGGQCLVRPTFSTAWTISPASSAEHSPGARRVAVNRPRWCHAQTGHLLVASSKSAGSQCCVTSNTRHALRRSPAAPESRAGLHRVPSCNAPRHKRNQGSAYQPCVVVGTCRLRNDGHAGWPTTSSRPRWTSGAGRERGNWGSLRIGLTRRTIHFKRLLLFSPLTLSLSPLRGEGIRHWHCRKLRSGSIHCIATTYLYET